MRKKPTEYVNKNFRLEKEKNERLKKYADDFGIIERHALSQAVEILLASKGY